MIKYLIKLIIKWSAASATRTSTRHKQGIIRCCNSAVVLIKYFVTTVCFHVHTYFTERPLFKLGLLTTLNFHAKIVLSL